MAARLLLLAASAAALVSAQMSPGRGNGCTAKSFSIPSWLLQDVKHSDGSVSFSLSNRAINYTASLECQTKESGWNACSIQGTPSTSDPLKASVQVSETSATFLLEQSWTCSDRGKALAFTAVGNSSAALNYTSPILVKGSLTSPVAITPVYPDGPTGHDSKGCTSRSEKPGWILTSIHYTDEPGDGESRTPFQNFNALLTNPANGYEASCMPAGSFGDKPDLSRLMCAGDEFQSFSVGQYPIVTQASFDPATATFTLNQTWFCDDTDAAKPLQITASGSTTLPLTCKTEETTITSPNTNKTLTNKYCTTTSPVSIPGKLGTVTTLRPYALEEPTPSTRGDGCTLTSILNPRWQFSHFGVAAGEVGFEVILAAEDRGFQYPIPIYQGEPVKGEDGKEGWYECEIGADGGNGLPLWPYKCRFMYEGQTGQGEAGVLGLEAEWECRDLDGAHPINFRGVTTTKVNTTLTCEAVDGQARCATTDPGYSWVADISNVTWSKAA